MKKRVNNNQGFISILTVLVMSVLLPILLFFLVEMNNYWLMKIKFQGFDEHIAASVSTCIDQAQWENNGVIYIDEVEANEVATDMLIQSYKLNGDLTPIENSYLKASPLLKVYVVNDVDSGGEDYITDEGYDVHLTEPSVIVYTEAQPKGLMFNKNILIHTIVVKTAHSPTTP